MSLLMKQIEVQSDITLNTGRVLVAKADRSRGSDYFSFNGHLEVYSGSPGEGDSIVSMKATGSLAFEVTKAMDVRIRWGYALEGGMDSSKPGIGTATYFLWFRAARVKGEVITSERIEFLNVSPIERVNDPRFTLTPGDYLLEAWFDMSCRVPPQEEFTQLAAILRAAKFQVEAA